MSGETSLYQEKQCETKESVSQEHKDLIAHFQEIVGNLDFDESVKIMIENNWNLEQAVHKIMDIPEVSHDSVDMPRYQETVISHGRTNNVDGVRRRHVNLNTPVEVKPFNQKVIKYPSSTQYKWYWLFLKIAWSPFQKIIEMFIYFFSAFQSDPRLTIVESDHDVQNFIEQLKIEVLPLELPNFVVQPYGHCIADAKENLQYLVVYLHKNTNSCLNVVRNVLCSDEFKSLLQEENIIFWGCSVQSSEGQRVSQTLRQYSYPFIGLIGMQANHKLALLVRFEGEINQTDFFSKLRSNLRLFEHPIIAARVEREERVKTQHIRRQQDIDYAESLRADRQKEEQLQQKRENERRIENQRKEEEQKQKQQKEEINRIRKLIASKLKPEPEDGDGTILIRIKLSSGNQKSCRFKTSDSLKMLYYVVKSQFDCPWNFQIISNFPKREWPCTPEHMEYDNEEIVRERRPEFNDPPTFLEFGISNNITVMVIDQEA